MKNKLEEKLAGDHEFKANIPIVKKGEKKI